MTTCTYLLFLSAHFSSFNRLSMTEIFHLFSSSSLNVFLKVLFCMSGKRDDLFGQENSSILKIHEKR